MSRGMEFIEARSIPEPNSGCWLWLGAVDQKGYGIISRSSYGVGSPHRYALIAKVGPIGALHALHKCDNPSCVNPDHLFPGTIADNNADMARKGRSRTGGAHGSQMPQSKLTPEAVKYIRANYRRRDPDRSFTALGQRFGVSKVAVADAYHGKWWRRVK